MCACLNLYWVHIGPEAPDPCRSPSLLVTPNTVSDSVRDIVEMLTDIGIISASFLMLLLTCNHPLDSLSPVPWLWPPPPPHECMDFYLTGMRRREWAGRTRAHFLMISVIRVWVLASFRQRLVFNHPRVVFRPGDLSSLKTFLIFLFDSILFLKVTQDSCNYFAGLFSLYKIHFKS